MTKRNFTWWLNTFVKLTSHNQRTFQILLAPCNPPGFPANGNGQWRDLKHNSWVTFSCNKKYQLEGRRQIQCKDGIWSGNRPKCVGKKIRIRCSFEFWFIWKRISERYQLFCLHRNCITLLSFGLLQSVVIALYIVDIVWQPHPTLRLFLKFFFRLMEWKFTEVHRSSDSLRSIALSLYLFYQYHYIIIIMYYFF